MASPIYKVEIFPNYSTGFQFVWGMLPTFNDPYPWVFQIEGAPTPDGDWENISPQLVNIFSWSSPPLPKVNKSAVWYFRVKLETTVGKYMSQVVQPYGDITKREFLIARDIMRREVLHASRLAGTMAKVLLKANWGCKCTYCTDPIDGRTRNSNCPHCVGTGFEHPYHGPYDMWVLFSADQQHQMVESPQTGTIEPKNFSVRALGNPVLKHNDIVIDVRSNKRYYISNSAVIGEIRRIPITQQLSLSEAAITDPIYKLDVNVH